MTEFLIRTKEIELADGSSIYIDPNDPDVSYAVEEEVNGRTQIHKVSTFESVRDWVLEAINRGRKIRVQPYPPPEDFPDSY